MQNCLYLTKDTFCKKYMVASKKSYKINNYTLLRNKQKWDEIACKRRQDKESGQNATFDAVALASGEKAGNPLWVL